MMRLALATALLVGCAVDESAGEQQLLVPEQVLVDWDLSFNARGDGLVALVPVDVMVYDGQSGEPVQGAELLLRGLGSGTGVIPTHAVLPPDPIAPDGMWWDAWRDRYVSLDPEVDPFEVLPVRTDATGLARVYVLVDRFALIGEEPGPAAVVVSGDAVEQTIQLRPR